MTWFAKAIKGILLNILSTDATATVASFIFLKAILRSPKTSEIIAATFVFSAFFPEKITVLPMNWELTESCLKEPQMRNILFYATTGQKKTTLKNFDEDL